MEDEDDEQAIGGTMASGEGEDGWLALLVIVGQIDVARAGACEQGREHDEIEKDKDWVANGFAFGLDHAGSFSLFNVGLSLVPLPLPLGMNFESESKSNSDTSSSLQTACPSALLSPWRSTSTS